MVEKGILHPDSSVQHYLPEFPEKRYKVTLDNLVHNTSGIRGEHSGDEYKPNFNVNLMKGLDTFKNDSLETEPGYYQYHSAFNYNLLGAVIEKTTGKDFKDVVQEMVIDTLHLENTEFDNPFITIKGRSNFYDHNIVAMLINAISVDLRSKAPSKGLLSNAEDLLKFGNALLYSDYVSEEVRNRLFSLSQLKSGFMAQNTNGWAILEDTYGREAYARSGYTLGGGATILIFPKEELVVTTALNTTMNVQEPPDYKIANYFLPKPETPVQPETNGEE
jgi:CubicO group peptidase (beta-lactamase class C family)